MYFTNEQQFERNKYIFLMNVVSALLDLNISANCKLTCLIFTKMAYYYSKVMPNEQERIKKIYQSQLLEIGYQSNILLNDSQYKISSSEQKNILSYIDELRNSIDQQESDQLKFILACHLNNVIDALKIEDFFKKYITIDEARFQKQPYFEVIHSLTLSQLLIFIESKIRAIYYNLQ